MKKIIALSFLIVLIFSSTFVAAHATNHERTADDPTERTTDDPTERTTDIGIRLENPLKAEYGNSLQDLLKGIVNEILLPIGGILAVLAFIYSGFLYVTAQGDETKIKRAHKALLYTAIGTAVLLGAWMISTVIANTINAIRG